MENYKITNKSYMPLQLIINDETYYVGPRSGQNVFYIEKLTEQIKNLRISGLLEIKKIK